MKEKLIGNSRIETKRYIIDNRYYQQIIIK